MGNERFKFESRTSGLLQEHERHQLEAAHPRNHALIVLQWKLSLLGICRRQEVFSSPSAFQDNAEMLMDFKKSCGSTIKFAEKNIPFAMIQVKDGSVVANILP